MGNGGIPIPDVSGLPIESPASRYGLENAAQALGSTVLPPPPRPGGIGASQTPDQSIDELNANDLGSFQNPGQFVPGVRSAEDPQQFPQQQLLPQQNDPLEMLKQSIAQRMQQRQAEQMQRGSRIKNLLTNALHGAGESMMISAGVETPEQKQQRDLNNLLQIHQAQALGDLRNAQIQDYQLKQQRVQRTMPDGSVIEIPFTHAATFDAAMAKVQAGQQAKEDDPFSQVRQMYGQSALMDLQQGLPGPSQRTQQLAQRVQEMTIATRPPAADTATAVKDRFSAIIQKGVQAGDIPAAAVLDAKQLIPAVQRAKSPLEL
jgi:hypothetical protein